MLSNGQSSWLQIQRSRVLLLVLSDFLKIVGLERGPLSLVSTTEELLGRNSSSSGLEIRKYGRGDPLGWPRHPLSAKVGTNFTDKQLLVGIVRSRTKATEFSLVLDICSELKDVIWIWYILRSNIFVSYCLNTLQNAFIYNAKCWNECTVNICELVMLRMEVRPAYLSIFPEWVKEA
jgi:hypothetical protein